MVTLKIHENKMIKLKKYENYMNAKRYELHMHRREKYNKQIVQMRRI